jgi:anti-sigma factor RsiW
VTIDPCRDWRGALGAAAIGRIDPAEEIGLRAHLDGCPACRAELRDLTAVAQSLATVPIENITSAPAEPSGALAERVLESVAHERDVLRGRRKRRALVGAGAFAGAAAAVVAIVLAIGTGGQVAGTRVALKSPAGSPVVATADVTLHAAAVGTEVDVVKVAGLPSGHYYWLWVTGDDGHRIGAGTFKGTRSSSEMRLLSALPLSEARRIWVTDDHRRVVLDAKVQPG